LQLERGPNATNLAAFSVLTQIPYVAGQTAYTYVDTAGASSNNDWLMGFGGALSIVFGALVLYQPNAGALTLVWLFGFYAILAGSRRSASGCVRVDWWIRHFSRARRP
jgi:uncharacterized membrane protein HdeD (DUF308 family)